MTVSTHVLDAARGRPAAGLPVRLERLELRSGVGWEVLAELGTDAGGRITGLESPDEGRYRLVFDVEAYRPGAFYPEVVITFRVDDPGGHYHVPLLLSPYAYSTYRGS
jgi:5-hydroxyisourate hydrolase